MIDPNRVETLFFAALKKSPDDRRAFLDEACGGDVELRGQVERLLAAQPAVGSFLEQPAAAVTPTSDFEPPPPKAGSCAPTATFGDSPATEEHMPRPDAGTVIAGKYKLVEQIGEGGMGTVWKAQQTLPVKRVVAVKLIKAGMDSRAVLARFDAERQALALMDHPNIAKVLDAGATPDGRPFFVMELVKGVPITGYCDEHKLTPRERLELFVPVCQAIQHAHQKGVIHRDIKPNNVLVALYDDQPVPKVIDFGVAKAAGQPLTDKTLATGFGAVVGTPEYMSPEQASFNNLDIDTRSDVYALGVLLYELLAGSPPFSRTELENAGLLEIFRVIREQEPPKPSTKLSTADALPTLSANRGTEPKRLTALLRGELDWIVMKALEKDRNRRYESANGFAADVQRYLVGEPVQAVPPSAGYRLRKFFSRNRGPVVAVCVVIVALLAGIAGTTWGMIRASTEREQNAELATIASAKAKEAEDARDRARTERDEKDKARMEALAQRDKSTRARDRTRDVLDAMTSTVAGDSLTTQRTIGPEQRRFLNEVLTYYLEFAGEKADDERTQARTANAALRVAMIESRLGRLHESVAAFRRARDEYAALAATFPASTEYQHKLLSAHQGLGTQLANIEDHVEAQRELLRAMEIGSRLLQKSPTDARTRRALATCYQSQASVLSDRGSYNEAVTERRKALELNAKLVADYPENATDAASLAGTHYNLASDLNHLGKKLESIAEYRKALEIEERLFAAYPSEVDYAVRVSSTLGNLAGQLKDVGRWGEAEALYRRSLAVHEIVVTTFPSAPEYRATLARDHFNLGFLHRGLTQWAEAEAGYRSATVHWRKLVADHPKSADYRTELANCHNHLAQLFVDQEKSGLADPEFRKAIAIQEQVANENPDVPQYARNLAGTHNNLGSLFESIGKVKEAEATHRTALAIREKLADKFPNLPEHRDDLAMSYNNLGILYDIVSRDADADAAFRKALVIREKLVADFPVPVKYRFALAQLLMNYGWYLGRRSNLKESEILLSQALGLIEKLVGDHPSIPDYRADLALCHNKLGLLFGDQQKLDDAEKAHRTALTIREKLVADFPGVPGYRNELSGSHFNLGLVKESRKDWAEAGKCYERAIAIQTKLAAEYPTTLDYRVELGRGYYRVAYAGRLGGGKAGESLAPLDMAIDTLTPAVAAAPGLVEPAKILREALEMRALTYRVLNRNADAVKDWEAALKLAPEPRKMHIRYTRAVDLALAGRTADAATEVYELEKLPGWTPGHLHTFARLLALASSKDEVKRDAHAARAVELLRKVAVAGGIDATRIKADAFLAPLHNRADFKQLLEDLVKGSPAGSRLELAPPPREMKR